MSNDSKWTVARYLATRLEQLGVTRAFGVPGNHLGPFLSTMKDKTDIKWVGTTNEINGGYAADAYARVKGLSVAGVTYGVGALSLINTVGGAFVERVPMVVINASPTNSQWLNFQALGVLTSHMSPNRESNLNAYRQVTVSAQVISNGQLATSQIDTALEICLTEKQPVYLEIRENVFLAECKAPEGEIGPRPRIPTDANRDMTEKAVAAAIERINELGDPIFWGGVEINRLELADTFQELVESTGIPFCTTIMGKSILSENHPQFAGVYNGNASLPEVRNTFNNVAKCRISLGAWTTSKNQGGVQALGEDWIKADHEGVSVGARYFPEVRLYDFMKGIQAAMVKEGGTASAPVDYYQRFAEANAVGKIANSDLVKKVVSIASQSEFIQSLSVKPADDQTGLTYDGFIKHVNQFMQEQSTGEGLDEKCPYVAISDAGFSLLSSMNLHMVERDSFHSQTSWLSIGYSVGAATGLKEAQPDKRPFVFVGDGSFQETCQALSSHTRLKQDNVVFVFNNSGFYGIEQMLVDSTYYRTKDEKDADFYNELHPWEYTKLAEVFGNKETPMRGFIIKTHKDLEELLQVIAADEQDCGPMIVQVVVPKTDYPHSINYKVYPDENKALVELSEKLFPSS